MTEYPYDFGNGYKVQTVFANKTETGAYGDIYDFRSEVERAHPGAEIMTGYCVIDEALGLIPEGCNDWNDSIPAAIQDYEEHIVPILEREDLFEMNCLVFDTEDNLLYEAIFNCKSGWLQDYFGVDNRTQLEAIWDVGDSWEDPENFLDALEEADLSGFQITALVRDNIKVQWVELGEGLYGDYDSMDPEDVELLRFDVFVMRDGAWVEKEDGSYCTQFPVSATEKEKLAGLEILLDKFHDALSADIDVSVKKLGEQMSWIDLSSVANHKLSFSPSEPNVADNLINAMVAYGQERSWSNGEIVHALTNLGVTYDDFRHAGAQYLVNGAHNYRFECSCETDAELAKMIDALHKTNSGFNYEIGSRLWYTPEGLDKTIMVEFDVATQDCRDLNENPDAPDWFTAYEVNDDQDYDCSDEIFTDVADNHISVCGLQEAMLEFAKNVFNRFYVQEQSLPSEQLPSASYSAYPNMSETKGGREVKKLVVKTWCENTKEGEEYLKFNGYRNAKRIGESNLYEVDCIGKPLRDVQILNSKSVKPLSEMIQSASTRSSQSPSFSKSLVKETSNER